MLSERLRERNLFDAEAEQQRKELEKCLKALNVCTRDLVACMRCAELDGTLSMGEIENYVLSRMEYYEKSVCIKGAKEFDLWMDDQYGRRRV